MPTTPFFNGVWVFKNEMKGDLKIEKYIKK